MSLDKKGGLILRGGFSGAFRPVASCPSPVWSWAILRYRYERAAGGIKNFSSTQRNPIFMSWTAVEGRAARVGHAGPPLHTIQDPPFLTYGGALDLYEFGMSYYLDDNDDHNTENFLINLTAFRQNFPQGKRVELNGAFSEVQIEGTRNVTVEITSYRAGEAFRQDFDFGVTGNTVQEVFISRTFTARGTLIDYGNLVYEYIGESRLGTIFISPTGAITFDNN
jgi:hypothetical protein